MRNREFWDLVDEVLGSANGRVLARELVLDELDQRTVVQALEDDVEPRAGVARPVRRPRCARRGTVGHRRPTSRTTPAVTSRSAAPAPSVHPWRWRPTLEDVGDSVVGLATTAVGLGVAIALVDGVSAEQPWSVLLAALVVAAGDVVLRPPLRVLARLVGAVGALVTGLAAQVLLTWAALSRSCRAWTCWTPGAPSRSSS